jgi:hypothetical protein
VYLFGSEDSGRTGVVYALFRDGKYRKLFATEKPVRAMASVDEQLFVAVDNAVYAYRDGNQPSKVCELPADAAIDAVAFDPAKYVLYASTKSAVWGIVGGRATMLLGNVSGPLRVVNGQPLVFDADRGELILIGKAIDAIRNTLSRARLQGGQP